MKQLLLFAWAAILLLGCKNEPTNSHLTHIANRLDSLISAEHKQNEFAGTIMIGSKDSILFQKAIGLADRVWSIPLQLGHRFDIASLNKSFTAALILLAVEEGKMELDDKLVDHITNYSGTFNPEITIHQMLTHTSGLPDYDGAGEELTKNFFRKFKRLHFTNEAYIDFISELEPKGQPGKQFYYSNFAYHLLAIILEKVYQKAFPELLQEKICKPLNLENTYSETSNEAIHQNLAEGYNYNEDTDTWTRNNFIDLTLGRRIFSSVSDLYKWGKAMNDTRLLSTSSLNAMKTNHLKGISSDFSYGYGWVVFDGGDYAMGNLNISEPYIIHGGATEGYKSMLINVDDGKYIVAMLSNTGEQTNEMQLTKNIINILIEEENEN